MTRANHNAGWTVTLYDGDNLSGASATCKAFVRNFGCDEFKFKKKTSSLKISKSATAPVIKCDLDRYREVTSCALPV